jgi:hypothetical protein
MDAIPMTLLGRFPGNDQATPWSSVPRGSQFAGSVGGALP